MNLPDPSPSHDVLERARAYVRVDQSVVAGLPGWARRSARFNPCQAVHRTFTNPTYLGRIRWRDQDFASEHEPLIDQDTFQRARAILAERSEDASRRHGNRSDFLLSGVIRCGHCGRAYIGMSAHGKGSTCHYYACTARQKYGPKACRGERVPREKLETAVLRQLTSIYRDGPLIHDALGAAQEQAQRERPALDEQRRSITAEITRVERSTERYFEAFEQGRLSPERCEQRVSRLNARLDDLHAQQAELADDGADETAHAPTAADLAAVANQIENVIAKGEPEQAKALLRLLIAELRVNSKTDIQPTYRIVMPDRTHTARVCATSEKVETIGRSEAKSSVLASRLLACAPLMRPKRRAPRGTLELFAQLVAAQTRVSEDAVQRPALEFAMQRHDQRDGPILVLEANVTAALAGHFPTELLKHVDQLSAGDDR